MSLVTDEQQIQFFCFFIHTERVTLKDLRRVLFFLSLVRQCELTKCLFIRFWEERKPNDEMKK